MITFAIISWLVGGLFNFIINIPTIFTYIEDVALVSWRVLKFVYWLIGLIVYVVGGFAGLVISFVHNKVWRI